MYLGIDIGGTKTLVATLDDEGVMQEKTKFPTPHEYRGFLRELDLAIQSLDISNCHGAGVAVPGRLDPKRTKVLALGNLPWENQPIKNDCGKILKCPVVIENDANLAALSEAMLHKEYRSVLYFTISTGIGIGVVCNQQLDLALLDSEGGHVLLPYNDEWTAWEKFASGKALYEHFNKKVMDIAPGDQEAWQYIARNLALGMWENIAIIQPDLVIVGGGVGSHFNKFEPNLQQELKKLHEYVPHLKFPGNIVQAQRPEEAVLYGCYDLAKQRFGDHASAD